MNIQQTIQNGNDAKEWYHLNPYEPSFPNVNEFLTQMADNGEVALAKGLYDLAGIYDHISNSLEYCEAFDKLMLGALDYDPAFGDPMLLQEYESRQFKRLAKFFDVVGRDYYQNVVCKAEGEA